MKAKRLVPLVGRGPQLRAAGEAVTEARQGRGKLLLVYGEAGIGKTRLCHEIRVGQDGGRTQVLTGRAGPSDAEMSYSALADSLRGARRSEPRLWDAAAGRAATLGPVVPELAHTGTGSGTLADRPVVFETLLDVVEEAATDRATLWLLEDLHWADPATCEFVGYAARRVGDMSLALVVTFRDQELPSDRWSRLLALGREPDVVPLALDRLDATDTQAMIRDSAPRLSEPLVEQIAARSAGNPLLVEELLASMGGPSRAVPDIVKAAVRDRTARLDAASLAVLEAAAALGPRFDAGLLLEVATVEPGRAEEQMAGGGLIVSDDDAEGDVLAFWHPLVWEAVYNDIALPRRRQLHTAIAEVLGGTGLQPESIARHYELADDPEAALETLLTARKADVERAGPIAWDPSARERNVGRGASLARAALDLARRHPALRHRVDELAPLAVGDLALAGRWTELEPLVSELWARRHSMAPRARASLANVRVVDLFFLGQVSQAYATAEDEVAHIEAVGDPAGAGMLFAQAAFLAYCAADLPAARRHAQCALEIAGVSGDAQVLIRGRTEEIRARHAIDGGRDEAAAQHRANAEYARSAGLGVAQAGALFTAAITSLQLDDFVAAERVGDEAQTWYALLDRVLLGLLHVLEGRPDPAERLLAQAGPEVRNGIPLLGVFVDAAEAQLFLHRGELHHARRLLTGPSANTEAARIPMLRSAHAAACGWLAWEDGRLDDAASALDASLGTCLSSRGYDVLVTGPLMLPLQADVLMRLGRTAELRSAIKRCVAAHPEPDRFFAVALAAARFRLAPSDEAAAAAERAAAAAPWPWLHALLGCWRGELMGDDEAALSARERFEAIAALRGVERADAVLRRLGKRVPGRRTPGSGELSPRELEVAALVAEGLTNSAIAARLFVSRPTVSSHVTHILTKLGFSSRAQIAAWVAAAHGRSSPSQDRRSH